MVNQRRKYSNGERQTLYAAMLRRTSLHVLNKGVTQAVSLEFDVPRRTVQRIWTDGQRGGVEGVNSKKLKNCGRKRIACDADAIKEIPLSKRPQGSAQ